MPKPSRLLATIAAALALALFAARPPLGTSPVLIELFTSQGCSSCPPADALLARISNDPKLQGVAVPVAFHVHYWNRLGWRDPFSSREWSLRQGEYVRAMELEGAYTPQIVINGTRQVAGSDAAAIYAAIEEESRRKPEGAIVLTRSGNQVSVRAQTQRKDAELLVVTFENAAATNVERGENGGRKLVNPAVVRSLIRAKGLATEVTVDPKLGVAAFLQERGSLRVLATGTSPAAPLSPR